MNIEKQKHFGRHYVPNKFGTNYNHCSDKICAIDALGIKQTKWNNLFHDQYGNHQKLYCHLQTGEDVLLKCEYSDDSVLITVHKPHRFKGIGDLAPELIEPVLDAIHTVYPSAEIVGEEKFIRILFN